MRLMSQSNLRRLWGPLGEAALVAVLVVVAANTTFERLEHWHGPAGSLSNELYIPSAMMACGKGFVNVRPDDVPGLRAFLDFRSPSWSPPSVLPQAAEKKLDAFQKYHRYLLYATGVTWRLFGISWDSMKILIAVLFSAMAVALYGLFRLGMNPLFSAGGAFVCIQAQSCLGHLWNIRDFGKAPFVLGALFLLGLLVKRPLPRRAYWGVACALGVVAGIGLGFRRDLIMCMPACFVVLACARRPSPGKPALERTAAVALLVAVFMLSGWPVLRSLYGEGSLGYHDSLMGMSAQRDDECQLSPVCYERLYSGLDMLVTNAAISYGLRLAGHDARYATPDNDIRERRLFMAFCATFPADMILRCYAASLNAVRSIILWGIHVPEDSVVGSCAKHWEAFGAIYALAALGLLAARDLRRGLLALFLLLWFCGYTTLQYNSRHYFHLAFIALWPLGFILDRSLRQAFEFVRQCVRRRAIEFPASAWKAGFRNAALFLALVAMGLSLPLYAARLYQRYSVGRLIQTCGAATLAPVETVPLYMEDSVLFRAKGWRRFLPAKSFSRGREVETSYLMAEFEGPQPGRIEVRYDSADRDGSIASAFLIDPVGDAAQGRIRYFFPVYEVAGERWTRFAGVAIAKEDASRFLGLSSVIDLGAFSLLPNLSLPTRPEDMSTHQSYSWNGLEILRRPWYYNREERFGEVQEARRRMQSGAPADAVEIYRGVLAQDPFNADALLGIADGLAAQQDRDAAVKAYRDAIAAIPMDTAAYDALDDYLRSSGSPEARVGVWKSYCDGKDGANLSYARYYLARTLDEQQDLAASVEAYAAALSEGLTYPEVEEGLGRTLELLGRHEEAVPHLRAALRRDPLSPFQWSLLIQALRGCGREAEARDAEREKLSFGLS